MDQRAEMQIILRGLEEQGVEVRTTRKGHHQLFFPDGTTGSMAASGTPGSRHRQRAMVRKAGLHWPLDPVRKSRQTRPEATDPAEHNETETSMTPAQTATPWDAGLAAQQARTFDVVGDAETVMVNSQLAEAWLERNTTNRRLSDDIVQKYAADMREGRWHYDGSPIRFDRDGRLLDGQHRLWAIIESQTEQKFLVVSGLETRAFVTIDTGKRRSVADILSIEHPTVKSTMHLAALGGLMWKWDQGMRGKSLLPNRGRTAAPTEALVDYINPQIEHLVHLNSRASSVANRRPGIGSSTLGLAMHVFEQIDKADSDWFFDRLADGAGLDAGSPILALRNLLERAVAGKDRRSSLPTDFALAVVIKAWNSYRRGEEVQYLRFRAGGSQPEQFPEPI